jgi:hypothetical protein
MKMKYTVALAALIIFLIWGGTRIIAGINYDVNIGNYISRAATSPDPTVAINELTTAIKNIENRGLTSGNTGVFFTYPTNDIGFWYHRLTDSRDILNNLPKNDSALEISNTMIRVHETLTGTSSDGHYVIAPAGIEIYPNNVLFFWWAVLSGIIFLISLVYCIFSEM